MEGINAAWPDTQTDKTQRMDRYRGWTHVVHCILANWIRVTVCIVTIWYIQRSAKVLVRGLVIFVPAG